MPPRSSDRAACRAALRRGSRSFSAAALLLPPRLRRSATALYAFCREADDAVDLAADPRALETLRARLDAVYAGRPGASAADRALADVVRRHALPRGLLDALIDGFAWDAEGRRYATLADLEAYAARVAGTVGAMMALLMGVRAPALVARACDLGLAMQLTNIARDVGEDARAGRLYLPTDWLRSAAIDPDAFLADPRPSPGLAAVVQRLLAVADQFYRRADPAIEALPVSCRPAIRAARLIYAGIGTRLAQGGFDSVGQRAVVPGAVKARLVLRALAPLDPGADGAAAPCPATRFLVECAAQAGGEPGRPRPVHDRAVWLIDLFEQVERRRLARASHQRA